MRNLIRVAFLSPFFLGFSGCTVITVVETGAAVVGTAASVAVTTGSLAVDAAVGTVKVTGKVVGAAADAVLPGDKE